jgi:outer membrane receptor protein involved in Fe transport
MAFHDLRSALFASAALCVCVVPSPAEAQERTFNVPAQPAVTGIPEFARQADVQILVSESAAQGRSTRAVNGRMPVRRALDQLLAGTGLRVSSSDGRTFTLSAAEAPGEPLAAAAADSGSSGQEIVVTGTNIRGAAPVGSELVTLSRDDITRGGFNTAREAVQSLPQSYGGGANFTLLAAGSTFLANSGVIGNTALTGANLGEGVNLRGQGSPATLVLFNGRRLAPAGTSGIFTDVSTIPISAVERVEVLLDGSSAIYGSDAVGGVVNFITRKDFDGAETRARIGMIGNGDALEYSASQAFGFHWDTGRIFLTYEYAHQDFLGTADRPVTANFDQRPRGGSDFRQVNYGVPGTITVGGVTYAIPSGQDGTALSPTDLVPGTRNFYNQGQDGILIPEQDRHTALISVSQDIGSRLTLFADGFFSYRHNTALFVPTAFIAVPSTNPWYVNPTGGTGPISVYSVPRAEFAGAPRPMSRTLAFSGTVGARLHLSESWETNVYYSYGRSDQRSEATQLIGAALNQAAASPDPTIAFNPFGDGSFAQNPQTIASILQTATSSIISETQSVQAIADGSLGRLPGGDARLAIGAEYRAEDANSPGTIYSKTPVLSSAGLPFERSRTVKALFAELQAPILSLGPGLTRLTLSGAIRAEEYSDFGRSIVPRLGAEWVVVPGFSFSGSWGRSFRAPDLASLGTGSNSVSALSGAAVGNPAAGTGIILSGGNPDLQPEKASTFSAGIHLRPGPLSVDVTWFRIDYSSRLAAPVSTRVGIFNGVLTDPLFASFVTLNPSSAEIAAACATGSLSSPVNCASTTFGWIVDNRTTNLVRSLTEGIDIALGYRTRLASGNLNLRAAATILNTYEVTVIEGVAPQDLRNTEFNPNGLRMRASANWQSDRWTLSAFLNYVGSYSGGPVQAPYRIPSWTTLDLGLGYRIPRQTSGFLAGTSFQFSIRNALNQDPPFVNVGFGFDPANANALGRAASLTLRKEW